MDAGLQGPEIAVPEALRGFFPDQVLKNLRGTKKEPMAQGESQDDEVGAYRRQAKAGGQSEGVQGQTLFGPGTVDHDDPPGFEVMPVHGEIGGVEKKPQIRGAGRYQ